MTQYARDVTGAEQLEIAAVQVGTSSDGKKMGAQAVAVATAPVTEATLQNAATQIQNGDAMPVSGLATAILNVTGTFVATLTFEVSCDDTNWSAIPVAQVADGVPTTTATTTGMYIVNVAGFKSLRARISAYTSGAVTVTGRGIAIDRSMRGVLLPEVTGTPGQTPPGKAVQIAGAYGGSAAVPYAGDTGNDSLGTNVKAILMLSEMMAFGPTGWDRWRNNTEGPLLQNAARTATTTSPNQTNFNARGVVITLNVTANPGGSETLSFRIRYVDPVSGSVSVSIASFSTVAATNGIYRLIVYPGANGTPDTPTNNKAVALPVPRTWMLEVAPSGSGSWTYSASYQYTV